MDEENFVEIDGVKVVIETEKAILCLIHDEEVWVPKSQIMEHSQVQGEGDEGFLSITKWFSEETGLE